jgi:murein DD-endopeptidase MepM/ murein hydrolase activator NlpD
MSGLKLFALVALLTAALPVALVYTTLGKSSPAVAAVPPAEDGCVMACTVANAPATTWVRPVDAQVWQAFRPAGNSDHQGVDLGAVRETPIRAAAAGVVVRVRCNYPDWYGCDRDGDPHRRGCGWYVDIRHDGDIYTRYCHMIRQPTVHEGQTVTTGQVIGNVGSSGGSSAPHLHFEVHLGGQSSATAIDPIPFMTQHGAPLGVG